MGIQVRTLKWQKVAFSSINANLFPIPPRSPNMNRIENIFNIAKQKLHAGALSKNITFENFDQFSKDVKETYYQYHYKL